MAVNHTVLVTTVALITSIKRHSTAHMEFRSNNSSSRIMEIIKVTENRTVVQEDPVVFTTHKTALSPP